MGYLILSRHEGPILQHCEDAKIHTDGENFCHGYIHVSYRLPSGEELEFYVGVVAAFDDPIEGCAPFMNDGELCLESDEEFCRKAVEALRKLRYGGCDPVVNLICGKSPAAWYTHTPLNSTAIVARENSDGSIECWFELGVPPELRRPASTLPEECRRTW